MLGRLLCRMNRHRRLWYRMTWHEWVPLCSRCGKVAPWWTAEQRGEG